MSMEGSNTIATDFEEEIVFNENRNRNEEEEAPSEKQLGKGRKRKSWVWNHFTLVVTKAPNGVKTSTGTCKYCKDATYNADSRVGTSNFKRHLLDSCSEYKKINSSESVSGKEIDQNLYRELLAEAIMKHGYSFSWVEHDRNRKIHKYLNDNVQHISRNTAKQVCFNMYHSFKLKIKDVFKELPGRICLTSDLWTAPNKRGFLCITAHYIDKDWILQIDNASNMDKMIDYLKQGTFKDMICLGQHFHIRCCAHILNLIVKNGLEVIKGSIHKVREAVRYIDGSDGRIEKFYDCAKKLNMSVSFKLWMDVPTRWNSTYIMLDRALKYKDALDNYFGSIDGTSTYVLDINEWEKVKKVCHLLEPFYEVTKLFSGSDYPTSSLYFPFVWQIQTRLNKAAGCNELDISTASKDMQVKFEKYWHDYVKVLAFGVIFDPRYKLEFVKYALKKLHGEVEGLRKVDELKTHFEGLYEAYEEHAGVFRPYDSRDMARSINPTDDFAEFAAYDQINATTTEVDVYLNEKKMAVDTQLNVLVYWKENSDRFPILSSKARDILAIPITTVASESTFSMGGRIISKWRSSLSSKSVEAIVTCKHWLTGYDDFNVDGNNVSADSEEESD
ncbi:hypothetical protein KSS87_014752 [Heliosperma pusillum]|nr:hypothetical protein KSS87_014752 [Heliosperma pusillum]